MADLIAAADLTAALQDFTRKLDLASAATMRARADVMLEAARRVRNLRDQLHTVEHDPVVSELCRQLARLAQELTGFAAEYDEQAEKAWEPRR